MIYGKTSLTRMPASASIDVSMIERHMKMCAASSMTQLTAPWPKTVLLTSPASCLAAQFQTREAQKIQRQGKTLRTGSPSMRSWSGQQQETSMSWQTTSRACSTKLVTNGSSACPKTHLTHGRNSGKLSSTTSSLPASSREINMILRG